MSYALTRRTFVGGVLATIGAAAAGAVPGASLAGAEPEIIRPAVRKQGDLWVIDGYLRGFTVNARIVAHDPPSVSIDFLPSGPIVVPDAGFFERWQRGAEASIVLGRWSW